MPLDTYANLQASVLSWLARPTDPLVSPTVPDMIRLFEAEANRRLRVADAERIVILPTTIGYDGLLLPVDCWEVRNAWVDDASVSTLDYLPPSQANPLTATGGRPRYYTIITNYMHLGPVPDAVYNIGVTYQSGVPPLSDAAPANWLLASHPDAYLFGTLVEAEAFIGGDERIPLWLQRRDAAFNAIETADRKYRWPGGLQIRAAV